MKWKTTGDLNVCRTGHGLVLLPDGRVAAVGGKHPRNEHYSHKAAKHCRECTKGAANENPGVEIWDPRTGHWSEVAAADRALLAEIEAMPRTKAEFRKQDNLEKALVTPLADGADFVSGGIRGFSTRDNGDEYTVVRESFVCGESRRLVPAGEMKTARIHHAAIRLADGRILVCGGLDDCVLASTEVWSPDGFADAILADEEEAKGDRAAKKKNWSEAADAFAEALLRRDAIVADDERSRGPILVAKLALKGGLARMRARPDAPESRRSLVEAVARFYRPESTTHLAADAAKSAREFLSAKELAEAPRLASRRQILSIPEAHRGDRNAIQTKLQYLHQFMSTCGRDAEVAFLDEVRAHAATSVEVAELALYLSVNAGREAASLLETIVNAPDPPIASLNNTVSVLLGESKFDGARALCDRIEAAIAARPAGTTDEERLARNLDEYFFTANRAALAWQTKDFPRGIAAARRSVDLERAFWEQSLPESPFGGAGSRIDALVLSAGTWAYVSCLSDGGNRPLAIDTLRAAIADETRMRERLRVNRAKAEMILVAGLGAFSDDPTPDMKRYREVFRRVIALVPTPQTANLAYHYALYYAAERNDADALRWLEPAVSTPVLKAAAKEEMGFASLRTKPAFKKLVGDDAAKRKTRR